MQISIKSLFAFCMPVVLILAGMHYLLINADVGRAKGLIIDKKPSSHVVVKSKSSSLAKAPTHMSIDEKAIDLDILMGGYDKNINSWKLDNEHAFFAAGTSTPIIYSHNQMNLFYNLRNVNEASKLSLIYADGSRLQLNYVATRFIDPNDGSILSEKNNNMVILLTCSGLNSEMRRIVYFELKT